MDYDGFRDNAAVRISNCNTTFGEMIGALAYEERYAGLAIQRLEDACAKMRRDLAAIEAVAIKFRALSDGA